MEKWEAWVLSDLKAPAERRGFFLPKKCMDDEFEPIQSIQELSQHVCPEYSAEDLAIIAAILTQSAFIETTINLFLHRLLIVPYGPTEEEFEKKKAAINSEIEKMNIRVKLKLLASHLGEIKDLEKSIHEIFQVRNIFAHVQYSLGFDPIDKNEVKFHGKTVWTLEGFKEFCRVAQKAISELIELTTSHQEQKFYEASAEQHALIQKQKELDRRNPKTPQDIQKLAFAKKRISFLSEFLAIERPRIERTRKYIDSKK